MSHSKSVSWHVSPSRSSVNFDEIMSQEEPPPSPSFSNNHDSNGHMKRKQYSQRSGQRRQHTPSLSISSDISFDSPTTSPTKRYHTQRNRQHYHHHINPTPIVSPTKEVDQENFLQFHDLPAFSPSLITDDNHTYEAPSSPYLHFEPNLQDIFITLANKERRVLEAKEELKVAEKDLSEYKKLHSSVLNIRIPNSQTTPPDSPSELESKRWKNSFRGSLGKSGLGITMPGDEEQENAEQEEHYRRVCEKANEIDTGSVDSSSVEPDPGVVRQMKTAVKNTIKTCVSVVYPIKNDAPQRAISGGSITKAYYEVATGIGFPRLAVVDRYIKTVC